RLIDRLSRSLAKPVHAGRVAVPLVQIWQHRLHNLRRGLGGGVVVEVDEVHGIHNLYLTDIAPHYPFAMDQSYRSADAVWFTPGTSVSEGPDQCYAPGRSGP